MNPSFMADEVSSTNNMQGTACTIALTCTQQYCMNLLLLSCVLSPFTAIEEILGVIIPRMKEFHDLLVRPPNVSLFEYDVHIHTS